VNEEELLREAAAKLGAIPRIVEGVVKNGDMDKARIAAGAAVDALHGANHSTMYLTLALLLYTLVEQSPDPTVARGVVVALSHGFERAPLQ